MENQYMSKENWNLEAFFSTLKLEGDHFSSMTKPKGKKYSSFQLSNN